MNLVEQIFSASRLSELRDTVALKWATGTCTYLALSYRIQSVSNVLNEHGIGLGQRVVLQCADTVDLVAAYFAVINVGAVAIAVSTRLDETELTHVIQDSSACALIFDSSTVETYRSVNQNRPQTFIPIHLDDLCVDGGERQEIHPVARCSHHEALWVYSSGSTSRPKGIVHTHKSILACSEFHRLSLEVKQGDLVFCTSRLSFAYALANGLLAPLRLGATVILHPEWITLTVFRTIIETQRPRIVFSVPSIFRNLLDHLCDSDAETFAVPDHYVSAGEHLPAEVRTRWQTLCNRSIINAYGCSETLFLALAGTVQDTPLNSVGSLLPHVGGQLRTGSHADVAEFEAPGVLYLSHPFMFSHYANRAEDTAARLVDDHFNTGDLYSQDAQGNWYHRGRDDELIKVAGQWVFLRDIEAVARTSCAVSDVAVVSAQDDAGMVRAALFLEPSKNVSPDLALTRICNHIEQHLPMVRRPSWIRVIRQLPRTANGKISRSELQRKVSGTGRD